MLKLYQRETCPYCKPVRERLTELNISYININLPKDRSKRYELIELTGVPYIPALVDGDVVLEGKLEYNKHILNYIEEKYGNK
ncbi:glutaredoxin domain-containing protein [Priestia megaterium]|uniref:glutaredoxin domain-containing protein n=1 Tax=Priestia megaterium TaxID=1404 RepID=UPI002E241972|nr:glutaredoxin domain-containing protein [Priestia megaterium]MED4292241.1 glutaredoxin domain-containing protein [Priestia megaterium]